MSDNQTPDPPPISAPINLEEEMKRSYLDYAMSVIVGRALPDVRDGLKPVHRRVLYGMWESGNLSNRAYKKSARIVGDVMGKYHPHGDAAIYDTVVRLAQDFSMRYPLVDGQGNFGSIDGDNPAAMRYTEVRLTRLAEEMLREDIDKETVSWIPNYDGSESEPQVLPARLPNLLINGSSGIAVGMATNIPPHNLSEVIAALEILIDRPDAPLAELMQVLPGPDFPTGGFIHGTTGIQAAYATGRGSIQVRAKVEFEELRGERTAIVVTEIPYMVNKAKLLEKIAELVKDKRIEGISDLRDESDRRGIRVVIELRRGEVPQVILNALYKMTQLQTTFGMNMLAIVDNQPEVLGLRQILGHFLDHRKTVVVRRTRYDLRKAEERAHILEGLLKALDHLDEVITTIRSSATPPEAKERLMEGFALSDAQAQAILDMRLQRLTGLERDKIVDEYREITATIERLRSILGSDRLVLDEIRGELRQILQVYGDERRTEIVPHEGEITIEDLIADEDMVITVTSSGYIKRSPLSLYRAQRRGGKGRTGMTTKEEDVVEHLHIASAHSYVLVFTESGQMHWIKVHAIPEMSPASRGKAIVNLLQLENTQRIATTVAVRDFDDEHFLVFATERGTIKKTALSAYSNIRVGGLIAINIDEGDRLLDVRRTDGQREILLATERGYLVRCPETDVRPMGRVTRGVRGINLRKGDRVVSMDVVETESDLLTITEKGYGKRTALAEYRVQGRGGMGIINLKVSDKTGDVVGVRQVEPGSGVMLITQDGKIIRIETDGVSRIGRATQGVRVMDLDEADRIVAIARVPERDEDDDGAAEDGDESPGPEPDGPDDPDGNDEPDGSDQSDD
ncbi:MAG: DNA gyrase subunit A [Acidobacteria bacterium]|nr:MAG: DNA gyrase subunit A [Acidobacteriota bacterium]REJ99591.1 MAG: DNA gyrase subunit A [Acidobacteriota bacterium]